MNFSKSCRHLVYFIQKSLSRLWRKNKSSMQNTSLRMREISYKGVIPSSSIKPALSIDGIYFPPTHYILLLRVETSLRMNWLCFLGKAVISKGGDERLRLFSPDSQESEMQSFLVCVLLLIPSLPAVL